MNVAVLMGGNSSEREVSLTTGMEVIRALQAFGYDVSPCPYDKDFSEVEDDIKSVDVVFNALHGGDGEGGIVQERMDELGICYTGSGSESSSLAMDKNLSKRLMRKNDIQTPKWLHLKGKDDVELGNEKFTYPVVVKPNSEGSTVGVTIVKNEYDLDESVKLAFQFDTEILIEEYIKGREITVAVLENEVLPAIEIIPSHGIYDYACKYTAGMSEYVCPAEMPEKTAKQLADVSVKIFQLLGCRDYSRVDYRMTDKDEFFCLEVNTLPGMTSTSLVPKAAKAMDISFPELIDRILKCAMKRKEPVPQTN